MKNIFIRFSESMLFAVIFLVFSSFNISSAKIFEVNVSNTKFTPKNITVFAGDTVRWINTQGNHNVNGNILTYPDNPESFGNEVGESWTYIFKFTKPGKYDYECTPHRNFGMVGTVSVDIANDVDNPAPTVNNKVNVYPNPASDYLTINLSSGSGDNLTEIIIADVTGKEVEKISVENLSSIIINTRNYIKGIYLINEMNNGTKIRDGMFIVK